MDGHLWEVESGRNTELVTVHDLEMHLRALDSTLLAKRHAGRNSHDTPKSKYNSLS